MLADGQQKRLSDELAHFDWSQGAGPKLKQILQRGVGVHHAGILPRYRRIVEELFQRKLLTVCVCTETLAAGINLPARSVVIPNLMKGPPDKKRLIEASSAHQMFGRAGRPQFDSHGYVYALAHEDDVKILRWRQKYDQIPEDTKDPGLLKAKKALKRKMPTRRTNEAYWSEAQFQKLCQTPPAKLHSRGNIPWRLMAYMLEASPECERIRKLVGKRLMDANHLTGAQRTLERMFVTLWKAGYVKLEPEPPKDGLTEMSSTPAPASVPHSQSAPRPALLLGGRTDLPQHQTTPGKEPEGPPPFRPTYAHPTPDLAKLTLLRGVNPLYGVFLVNQLGIADRHERLQAFESILDVPGSVSHFVRVPRPEDLPPGPLATTRLDMHLLQLGLVTLEQLGAKSESEDEQDARRGFFEEERVFVLRFSEKLRLLFDHDFPGVPDVQTNPVWIAGDLLEYGEFNKYITSKGLQKQEGIIFRHLLRLILLVREFAQFVPPETTEAEWKIDLREITERLAAICRVVDPTSTDQMLEQSEL